MMFLGLNLMSHFNYENITTYTQRTATDLKVGHFISFTPLVHAMRLPSGSYFIVRPVHFHQIKLIQQIYMICF